MISRNFLKDTYKLLSESTEIKSIKFNLEKAPSIHDYDFLNEFNTSLNEGFEYVYLEEYNFIEEGIKSYLQSKGEAAKGFINNLVADKKKELNIQNPSIGNSSDIDSKIDYKSNPKIGNLKGIDTSGGIQNPSVRDSEKKAFLKKFADLGDKHKEDARQKIDNTIKAMSNNKIQMLKLSSRNDLSIAHIDKLISNASRNGHKEILSTLAMRHDLQKPHIDSLIKNHTHLNDDAFKRLMSHKHINSSHIDSLINSGNERASKLATTHEKTTPQQISKLLDSNHPGIHKAALIRAKAILNTKCNC